MQAADIEKFPEPEQIKSTEESVVLGMNKSKRSWKLGSGRNPQKNFRNRGNVLTWDEKMKKAQQTKALRNDLKQFKEQKLIKRKQMKELRKIKKKQQEYNEVRAGKFQVIKNPKKISKWTKKMKKSLVKLPAEVFESIINGRQ